MISEEDANDGSASKYFPKIVLCVPGPWSTKKELVRLGRLVSKVDESIDLEFRDEHDERMTKAFEISHPRAEPSLDKKDFAKIEGHRSVVYLSSDNFGRTRAARVAHHMMHAARALLDAGGIAVKCESSGIALSAKRHRALTKEADEGFAALKGSEAQKARARLTFFDAMIRAYVFSPLGAEDGSLHTCGMHLLGHPDVSVEGPSSDAVATHELMRIFSLYLLAECDFDGVADGHTFRTTANEPRYRCKRVPCTGYEEDDLFWNRFGLLRLSRILH